MRTDAPTGATFKGFLARRSRRSGSTSSCDVAVATGSTDYAPYVAEIQQENPDAVLISHTDSVTTQLIAAMAQLNAKVPLGGNPGSFTLETLRKYKDITKGTVLSDSFPYPVADERQELPRAQAVLRRHEGVGQERASARRSCKTSDFCPWISTLAFVNVTKGARHRSRRRPSSKHCKTAKDVDLLGLTPPWTPSTPGFSVFKSSSNHFVYISRFDGKNVVTEQDTGRRHAVHQVTLE